MVIGKLIEIKLFLNRIHVFKEKIPKVEKKPLQ